MKSIPLFLSALLLIFVSSCGKINPSNCDCEKNLDLVVNFSENAANTYVGQFDKEVFEACIEKFKLENSIAAEQEVLIKKVYKQYKGNCLD